MDKLALEYVLEKARLDDINITQEQGRQSLGALGLSGQMALARIGAQCFDTASFQQLAGAMLSTTSSAQLGPPATKAAILCELAESLTCFWCVPGTARPDGQSD